MNKSKQCHSPQTFWLILTISAIIVPLLSACFPSLVSIPQNVLNPDGTVNQDVSYSVELDCGSQGSSYGNMDIYFPQQSFWDCGPSVMKMWTKYLANLAVKKGELPYDSSLPLEDSVYFNMVLFLNATRCDSFLLPQYKNNTGYSRGQYVSLPGGGEEEKKPDACLDWVKCKFDDFSLKTDIDGHKGTSVFHANDFSGRPTLLFSMVFIQELFRFVANSALFEGFTKRYGNDFIEYPSTFDAWYNAAVKMTERYPFPIYAGTLNMPYGFLNENLRFRLEIQPTDANVLEQDIIELFATDDADAFVLSILDTFHVKGSDFTSYYENHATNRAERAIMLLTRMNTQDVNLHYVLLYGIKVHVPQGKTFQEATFEFLILDPLSGKLYPQNEEQFVKMISLSASFGDISSPKLLYNRHIGIELGNDGSGRTRAGLKGSDVVAQIDFMSEARYFDALRKKRETRKILPVIMDLLMSED